MSAESQRLEIFDIDWLDQCPSGVLVLDQERRTLWANTALATMLGVDRQALIDKDRESLSSHLALLDGDPLVQVNDAHGEERWLQCAAAECHTREGIPVHVHFYQEITAQVELQRQRDELRARVEALSTRDPVTGVLNRRALVHVLEEQVTRSRRYQNPLLVVLLRIRDANERPLSNEALREVSHALRDRLRWADIIGRYDDDSFLLVLPETRMEAGNDLVASIQDAVATVQIPDQRPIQLHTQAAYAAWEKGDDPRRLIQRAVDQLLALPTS
ncbi:MAG TPA: diguanylate cyclase [Chromatiales bacterium]|nr:diguanylate cyclase [Chromatiales bacterium]